MQASAEAGRRVAEAIVGREPGRDRAPSKSIRKEKVLVLISGSAAAQRAHLLLSDLNCPVIFRHRSRHKLWSLLRFIWAGIAARPTIIYAIDPVWSSVIAALILKPTLRCRFVLDTGDAAFSLARSAGRIGSLACLAVWALERAAIHLANVIVVRGTYHRSYLRGNGARRVVEIPDCVALDPSTDASADSQALEMRRRLGLEQLFTVGTLGSCVWSPRLHLTSGWDLVEAMSYLNGVPIHAVIIGDGDGLPYLRRRIAELGQESRVTIVGPISYAAVNAYVRMLDVCLLTQSDDRVGWARTTGELPVYLANNRFVLATDVGQANCVLPSQMRLPFAGTVDREYPRRLAERLRAIVRDPAVLTLGSKGREIVRMHFDASRLSVRLATSLGLERRESWSSARVVA